MSVFRRAAPSCGDTKPTVNSRFYPRERVETTQDYGMPGSVRGVEITASVLDRGDPTGGAVLTRKQTK